LVDGCLEMIGGYELAEDTRALMLAHADKGGTLQTDTEEFAARVGETLQLLVSTQEYLFT